jgi:hypothetical protein
MRRTRPTIAALVLAGALAAPVFAAGPAGAADTPPSGQSGGPSQPGNPQSQPGDPQSQPPNGPAAPMPTPPTPGTEPVGQILNQILGGGGGKG